MKNITARQRFGSRPGLERIGSMCRLLGDPQHCCPMIHLAGTNGKGSSAAFLASILQHAGLTVGLFTSPHLVSYRERFSINGRWISEDALDAVLDRAEAAALRTETEHPEWGPVTEFELGTAAAFAWFADAGVDAAVVETGLGGRLDATNIVVPVLSLITPIGYDHMDWLGHELRQIAAEKAGIIKPQIPVAAGLQEPEAAAVLMAKAEASGSAWRDLASSCWRPGHWNGLGGTLHYPDWDDEPFSISMLGGYQLENAGLALLAADMLRQQGWSISGSAAHAGLAAASWPGRMELVSQQNPWLLLDGAHNQQGIVRLAEALAEFQREESRGPYTFVFAMLENKDPLILEPLFPLAARFIATKPYSSRIPAFEPGRLAAHIRSRGVVAEAASDPLEALAAAENDRAVVCCGSLYLLGSIKAAGQKSVHI